MSNYPAGALNDDDAPFNEVECPDRHEPMKPSQLADHDCPDETTRDEDDA